MFFSYFMLIMEIYQISQVQSVVRKVKSKQKVYSDAIRLVLQRLTKAALPWQWTASELSFRTLHCTFFNFLEELTSQSQNWKYKTNPTAQTTSDSNENKEKNKNRKIGNNETDIPEPSFAEHSSTLFLFVNFEGNRMNLLPPYHQIALQSRFKL